METAQLHRAQLTLELPQSKQLPGQPNSWIPILKEPLQIPKSSHEGSKFNDQNPSRQSSCPTLKARKLDMERGPGFAAHNLCQLSLCSLILRSVMHKGTKVTARDPCRERVTSTQKVGASP